MIDLINESSYRLSRIVL